MELDMIFLRVPFSIAISTYTHSLQLMYISICLKHIVRASCSLLIYITIVYVVLE